MRYSPVALAAPAQAPSRPCLIPQAWREGAEGSETHSDVDARVERVDSSA